MKTAQSRFNLPPCTLRAPSDVHLAHRLFGANCGPASLAALLSVQVCDVIALFDQFPFRRHTTLRKMVEVLGLCGLQFFMSDELPDYGLALIQFEGHWSHVKGSEKWASCYTHWVGVREDEIYEINSDEWKSRSEWEAGMLPILLSDYPGATGWRVKRGLSIVAQEFVPNSVLPGFDFGHGLHAG